MYTQKNIAVLWMVPFYEELDEERYAPLDYERYLVNDIRHKRILPADLSTCHPM
jgi:hypothetical protein